MDCVDDNTLSNPPRVCYGRWIGLYRGSTSGHNRRQVLATSATSMTMDARGVDAGSIARIEYNATAVYWRRTPGKLLSTLSSPAIPQANHAAPCRKTLGRMLFHPLGELRRAHQAGLHRDVSEARGGDGLLAAICRRGETAEHDDDLDHDRGPPSLRWALALLTI